VWLCVTSQEVRRLNWMTLNSEKSNTMKNNFLTKIFSLFSREEKKSVRRLFVVIIILGFVEVLGVVSIAPFMALAANPGLIHESSKVAFVYNSLHFTSDKSFLIFAGFTLLFIFIFNNVFSAFATWLILRFSSRQNHRLSTKMLAAYLAKPYTFFLSRNSADLAKNVLVECTALAEYVILPFMQGTAKIVSIFLICLLLLVINPLLAVCVGVSFSGTYFLIYMLFYRRLGRFGAERLEASTRRFTITDEAFGGIKEIKAKNRESGFVECFSDVAQSYATMVVKNQMISQMPRYLLEAVAFGGILIITIYLIDTTHNFSAVIPLLALYALAGYRLMPSLQQLYEAVTTIRFHQSVVDLVCDDLGKVRDMELGSDELVEPISFKREISLRGIVFSYEGGRRPAIDNLSVVIKKNTSVAFVGHTGAGKTTIVDIILGLLQPDQGGLSIDGIQIDASNRKSWQKIIGYIPQEMFLCDGSIAENITFGLPKDEIDMSVVKHAAKVASLDSFVSNELPEGYDTVVGERGVRLSGGQRQRIGIARAIYDNPEVLVLDEATSALDGITEQAVIDAIENLTHKKTIIVIAHRLTTVKNCDVIYFLEHGKIVDQGTYEELLEKNEQFKAMAKAGEKVKKKVEG